MIVVAVHADAQRYDATKALTPKSDTNPNGVWSYGYLETGFDSFIPYTHFIYEEGVRIAWQDPNHVMLEAPTIWKNLGTDTINGVLPGHISLHPGWTQLNSPFDDAAVIRFTAPAGGQYAVKLALFAGNMNETEAWVIKNSKLTKPLVHFPSTTPNPTWNKTVSLAQGATLDVVVGHAADGFLFDDTPISLVITKK